MSDDFTYSKKGQRKVSTFIGQELLYDYLMGQLDDERKLAVEEYVRGSKEAQMDIQKIRHGLAYTEKLGEVKTADALLVKLNSPTTYSQVLLQKIQFEEWSPGFKMGLEALVVALGITVFAVLIPWHKLMDLRIGSNEVILTEVAPKTSSIPVSESETTAKEEIMFPDEGATSATTTTLKVAASTPTTTLATTTTLAATQKTAAVASPTPEKTTATQPVASEEKRQGFLSRGSIEVTNVPAVTPKIVEKLQELGGRKAGQVELGWSKNGDSSYFHFTMPESRYEEMLTLFAEYGTLKIQKEKHERVMPEGILRLIITVDEKK